MRLLASEALSVGELTTILGLAQPTISKKLGELKRAGLVLEERNGAYSFHRAAGAEDPIWQAVASELVRSNDTDGDRARLAEVVRRRADRGGSRNQILEPGRSWPAWARALGWLIPPLRVADLGCGDGALTAEIARWAGQVVAVDRDRQQLAAAWRRLRKEGFANVAFRCEAVENLGIADATVDVVILSQALHAFADPDLPLRQAHRILVAGGRLLLLDLAPHGETWVRDKLGHAHLGFRREEILARLQAAGFGQVLAEDLRKGPGEPFRILLVTGVKKPRQARAGRPARRKRRVV
jgi:ArsR family transcriptional regulator